MTKFVSYMDSSVEYVHATDCGRAKRDSKLARSPLYPTRDTLRDVIVEVFSDIWSDTYPSTQAAIDAGELEDYTDLVHVCPCAVKAGFKNHL